jgi:hypothetical protein
MIMSQRLVRTKSIDSRLEIKDNGGNSKDKAR